MVPGSPPPLPRRSLPDRRYANRPPRLFCELFREKLAKQRMQAVRKEDGERNAKDLGVVKYVGSSAVGFISIILVSSMLGTASDHTLTLRYFLNTDRNSSATRIRILTSGITNFRATNLIRVLTLLIYILAVSFIVSAGLLITGWDFVTEGLCRTAIDHVSSGTSHFKSSSSQKSSLEPLFPLLAYVKGQAIDTRQHGSLQPWLHDHLTSVDISSVPGLGGPSNQTRPGYQQIPRYVPIEIRLDTTIEITSFSMRDTDDMGSQEAETNAFGELDPLELFSDWLRNACSCRMPLPVRRAVLVALTELGFRRWDEENRRLEGADIHLAQGCPYRLEGLEEGIKLRDL
ncbi:hypothetical protein JMJ35_000720 [Cladonia borealis]|uniref:Uncharacterized protein n=1 Tax=Cladonia borealis TaxID=184061 RepID=A0AA39RB92_9LECA|nr:hypothetical protein JMJ35_000720 [Cladonia borealis]